MARPARSEVGYFVTNRPHHFSSIVVELVQLPDHVPISVTWRPPTSETIKVILTQTPGFSIPPGLSCDIWRNDFRLLVVKCRGLRSHCKLSRQSVGVGYLPDFAQYCFQTGFQCCYRKIEPARCCQAVTFDSARHLKWFD